ncbi:hypothetical protein CAOG_05422 [Capsaspora owczarzaki ATCC 30864]|eukprot:XP_004346095.2 hypothetical protein CAOG_05422 [Capsaspora owczarzaki ATCC 30864]
MSLSVTTAVSALLLLLVVVMMATAGARADDVLPFPYNLGTTSIYHPFQDSSSYTLPPAGSVLVHSALLARHGSRYPTNIADFTDLDNVLYPIEGQITNPALQWLKSWEPPFTLTDEGLLVQRGMQEHYDLAQRLSFAFPDTFRAPYSPITYTVQATQVSRAAQSAASFTYGLFEGNGQLEQKYSPVAIWSNSMNADFTLRFFDACPAYNTYLDSDASSAESNKYISSAAMKAVAARISATLNVTSFSLTPVQALEIYSMCQYEVAVLNITNQFCALIDPSDVDTLNYVDDLLTYWQIGYGNTINYNIASPLLQDIISTLVSTSRSPGLAASLRFAHAETVAPLIALLGLYKDGTPLRASASPAAIANRLWRGSSIIPFAANLHFAMYFTPGERATSNYVVGLFHNEMQVAWPGCEADALNTFYCPLDVIQRIYADQLSVSFDSTCGIGGSSPSSSTNKWAVDQPYGAVIVTLLFFAGVVVALVAVRIRANRRRSHYQSLN